MQAVLVEPPDEGTKDAEEGDAEVGPVSDLPPPVRAAIAKVNPESSGKLAAQIKQAPEPLRHFVEELAVVQESTVGPLPPPSMLAGYERVMPGFTKIFADSFRQEGIQRIKAEDREFELLKTETESRRADRRRGMNAAAALGSLCIVGATFLGMHGHDWLGGVLATTALGAILTAFLAARRAPPPSDDTGSIRPTPPKGGGARKPPTVKSKKGLPEGTKGALPRRPTDP